MRLKATKNYWPTSQNPPTKSKKNNKTLVRFPTCWLKHGKQEDPQHMAFSEKNTSNKIGALSIAMFNFDIIIVTADVYQIDALCFYTGNCQSKLGIKLVAYLIVYPQYIPIICAILPQILVIYQIGVAKSQHTSYLLIEKQ